MIVELKHLGLSDYVCDVLSASPLCSFSRGRYLLDLDRLCDCSEAQLLVFPRFGPKTIRAVKTMLRQRNRELAK